MDPLRRCYQAIISYHKVSLIKDENVLIQYQKYSILTSCHSLKYKPKNDCLKYSDDLINNMLFFRTVSSIESDIIPLGMMEFDIFFIISITIYLQCSFRTINKS